MTPGSGTDGYAIVYNHGTGKFELGTFDASGAAAAAVAAHVALSNPHSQYFLASGVSAYGATLIDDADASAARATLGLGTAAVYNVGTGANNIVQLNGSAKLPAVDGSLLTNLPGGAVAGSATQVIFNDAGAYAGDAGLTYAKATDRLAVVGGIVAGDWSPPSDSTTAVSIWNAARSARVVTVDTTNQILYSSGYVAVYGNPNNGIRRNLSTGGTDILCSTNSFRAVNATVNVTLFEVKSDLSVEMLRQLTNGGTIYSPTSVMGFEYWNGWGSTSYRPGTNKAAYAHHAFTAGDAWDGTGITIDDFATLYINKAPFKHPTAPFINGNKWALWVDDGSVRIDGNVTIGGTTEPTNKLDVAGTVQADGLRLDVTPTSETVTPTHTITISLNGTNYKIPCVAA